MTEAVTTCLICDSLIDFLQSLPWCKQDDGTLVAVAKCVPEFIVAFGDHEVKVFPGGMSVKLNKSWLSHLQEQNEQGTPLPILCIWRPQGVELWYRRNNSWDFPYDTWQNPVAEAYERERVFLPREHGGAKFDNVRQALVEKCKFCPPQIPKQ